MSYELVKNICQLYSSLYEYLCFMMLFVKYTYWFFLFTVHAQQFFFLLVVYNEIYSLYVFVVSIHLCICCCERCVMLPGSLFLTCGSLSRSSHMQTCTHIHPSPIFLLQFPTLFNSCYTHASTTGVALHNIFYPSIYLSFFLLIFCLSFAILFIFQCTYFFHLSVNQLSMENFCTFSVQ